MARPQFAEVTNPQLTGNATHAVGGHIVELDGSAVDLVATYGACARRLIIKVAGSGTLNIETPGVTDTSAVQTPSLTGCVAGDVIDCAVNKIRTGTNVTKIWAIF